MVCFSRRGGATNGPTDTSEKVAVFLPGTFTPARRIVRGCGTIVLDYWRVVKGFGNFGQGKRILIGTPQ